MELQIPEKLAFFLGDNARYKVAYGGRGAGKSYVVADSLLVRIIKNPKDKIRVLCTRELQNSIRDSVHQLLCDRIKQHGWNSEFEITRDTIRHRSGAYVIFKGLRANPTELKSLEGIDICWVEEAEKVSAESWALLLPTIRKESSEIWITFNTGIEDDPVYQLFVKEPRPNSIVKLVNYYDNPWFPEVLKAEELYDRLHNPIVHRNRWLGEVLSGGRFFEEIGTPERPFDFMESDLNGRLYGSLDSGTTHATSFGLWWIASPRFESRFGRENTIHRLFTYRATGGTIREHAAEIYDRIESFKYTKGWFPSVIWYDYAMDTKVKLNEVMVRCQTDEYRDIFRKKSVEWRPANKNKENGCALMRDMFRVRDNAPLVYYWEEYNSDYARAMRRVPMDENKKEIYAKIDGDDEVDEARYGLVGLNGVIGTQTQGNDIIELYRKYNESNAVKSWKEF